MTKIFLIFYSMYGHNYKMAQEIKKGVEAVEGVECVLYQVPETLPESVLTKMHAPPKPDVPVITAADLTEADGFIFGFPTRFGMPAAQMQSFWNSTGGLWQSGGLVGKPATCFTSVATQGGGMETTILTAVPFFAHHGIIFVPLGYTHGANMFSMAEPKGGSPWGSGTFAGIDGSRQPSELELEYAKHQGTYFAGIAKKLKK